MKGENIAEGCLQNEKSYQCPEELYIYLLNGLVNNEDETEFGKSFIGNWIEDSSSFLFFSEPSDEKITMLLKRNSSLSLSDEYHFTYEEWQGGGLDTLRIGQFVISTPWTKEILYKESLPIILDPGVVFGNGLHPTTQDCLRALEYTFRDRPFSSVLDLGTGTGILSIAAALLGADKVLAVDLNPLCIKTANNNIRLNKQSKVIQAVEGTAEDFANRDADLICANIHHEVVACLLKNGCYLNKDRVIISGLMRSQASDIKAVTAQFGMNLIQEWVHEMTWYTMLFTGSQA